MNRQAGKKTALFAVVMLSILLVYVVPMAYAQTVVATIDVTGYFAAYDSKKGEVFVANEHGTVSVISDAPAATTTTSSTIPEFP